jgi:hypothetical protein
MTEEIIHVGINEPKQHRKEILTAAIDVIESLKNYEKYKKIEKEKNLYRTYLIKNIKQLNIMLKKFETMIPKLKIKEKHKETKPKETTQQKKKVIKKPIKIKDRHLERLEEDIMNIRSKINKL